MYGRADALVGQLASVFLLLLEALGYLVGREQFDWADIGTVLVVSAGLLVRVYLVPATSRPIMTMSFHLPQLVRSHLVPVTERQAAMQGAKQTRLIVAAK